MPEKSAQPWTLLSLIVAVVVPLGGGFIQYSQTHRFGEWSLGSFLVEMFTSGFVGFIAFWVCHDALAQPDAICAAVSGITGNLGVNTFAYVRYVLRRRLGVPPNYQDPEPSHDESRPDQHHPGES